MQMRNMYTDFDFSTDSPNTNEVVRQLCRAIPYKDTWSTGERYGPYWVPRDLNIKKVLYCVTPTKGVTEQFIDGGYDLLVSHHPYFIPSVNGIKPPQIILHTALDCCEGGLNDQWRDVVGMKDAQHFDKNLGWAGKVDPIHPDDFYFKIRNFLGADPIGAVYCDKNVIESVVVCSGLGGMVEMEAWYSGADCYVLGQACSDPQNSRFPAMIEIGHTLSEHGTGLKKVRSILEPMGITVDGADLKYDIFGSEVYRKGIPGEPM
jgi:putative NIF3 family GTP cyclohydrolase 1 type 2